jgi:hypothetical protein
MDLKEICLLIFGVVTIASVIVKLTPSETDNKVLGVIIKILKVLSLYKNN